MRKGPGRADDKRNISVVNCDKADPSGAPEFISGFIRVCVTRSLVVRVFFVDRCLSFCPYVLLGTVFSVLLRFKVSSYMSYS
jgi:hypothetical protein